MILIIHQNNEVIKVLDKSSRSIEFNGHLCIVSVLYDLANQFNDELIIWCHQSYVELLNRDALQQIFHHKRVMASFAIQDRPYLTNAIGYVDQSIYIKVNKSVPYPTWLFSSDVGGVFAEALNLVSGDFKPIKDFDFFLNSLAKTAMPQGLFCYSDPRLLLSESDASKTNTISKLDLFKFVKQHYKPGWVVFLFMCLVLFDKKFPIVQLVNSLRYNKFSHDFNFNILQESSTKKIVSSKDIDVIIPTIGRKDYLYDVLKDLSKQTLLPKNVILIEQNPNKETLSQLDYLKTERWPFKIKHRFIHQLGVCNARNMAIELIESDWVFFADDDIRFKSQLLEKAIKKIEFYGINALNMLCLQPNEKQVYFKTAQTPIFGSGTSIVNSRLLKHVKFNMNFEFGFGEDSDFGMQIRNRGEDIVFVPTLLITHLKAPIGGFRITHKNKWDNEKYQPKPSPTIMLLNQKYLTIQQLRASKCLLFIKFYKSQSTKNPFQYLIKMKKRWQTSLYWYKQISAKEHA